MQSRSPVDCEGEAEGRARDAEGRTARADQERGSSPPFTLTVVLFVVSGATGLIDQLCFSKYLSYVVGGTAHAVSAVLSAFMTGLALGAFLGGRFSRRVRRPLLAYGVLELLVAGTVALSPWAFRALSPVYAEIARSAPESLALLSFVRWLLSLLIVIVPTTAMGATLPLLSRCLAGSEREVARSAGEPAERAERRLAALYAANTAGGALGALGAAYAVLPLLGMDGTVFASALGSALIGVLALRFGANTYVDAESPTATGSERAPANVRASASADLQRLPVLYAVAFASGALVFSAEVIFTHLLALIIGNSAYAFGLILAAFLSCLFVGASSAGRAQQKFGDSALPLGLAASALCLVLTLPLWDALPLVFSNTGPYVTSFVGREVTRALVAFVMLALPTVFMGLTFPLLLRRVASRPDVGQWVGRLTTINTLGAVAGALGTGYWLLPALGSERSLFAVASLFLAMALLTIPFASGLSRRFVYGAAGATLLAFGLMPRWNLARLTAGTNVYFQGWEEPEQVPFVREDVQGGVTTVTRKAGVYTLYTNGKFQGNTGWEMHAQRFFAHYPSIFVERFERALVIGLGTGTTLGTLAAYPWLKLDVVEISPAIVEAAERYFSEQNHGALRDPRTQLHLGDGRNFLLVENGKYELISMELSSIWFAGAASLYSREFYQLVHERLSHDGVFQQWVQLHHVTRKDLATVVHTLRSVFPHVALFYGGGQGILVASPEPLRASAARVQRLAERPAIQQTTPDGRELMDLLADVLVAGSDLDQFLEVTAAEAGEPLDALVSTDGNLYLEYATPRGNVLPWSAREELVTYIEGFRTAASQSRLRAP